MRAGILEMERRLSELVTSGVPRLAARTSLRQQVATSLRAAVIAGDMVPGVTYSSAALAERFGTSATPVREAMLDLIKEGLVVAMPNKGFRVVQPDAGALDEMREMLLLLEVPTTGKIAATVTADQIARLREHADATVLAARAQDVATYVEQDRRFHHDLLELSRNSRLVELVDQMRTRTWLYGRERLETGETLDQAAAEHLELLEALGQNDRRRAERVTRRHLQQSHVLHGAR